MMIMNTMGAVTAKRVLKENKKGRGRKQEKIEMVSENITMMSVFYEYKKKKKGNQTG